MQRNHCVCISFKKLSLHEIYKKPVTIKRNSYRYVTIWVHIFVSSVTEDSYPLVFSDIYGSQSVQSDTLTMLWKCCQALPSFLITHAKELSIVMWHQCHFHIIITSMRSHIWKCIPGPQ